MDELMESPTGSVLATSSAIHPPPAEIAAVHRRDSDIIDIKSAVGTLIALNKELLDKLNSATTNRSTPGYENRSNGRWTRSRSRSTSPSPRNGMCYYHNRYGAAAQRCTKPCNFHQPEPHSSQQGN